jgi:hypothetical protein
MITVLMTIFITYKDWGDDVSWVCVLDFEDLLHLVGE